MNQYLLMQFTTYYVKKHGAQRKVLPAYRIKNLFIDLECL